MKNEKKEKLNEIQHDFALSFARFTRGYSRLQGVTRLKREGECFFFRFFFLFYSA